MLNYYHLLCLHPSASRSDIQAALDKQQALGKLPPATLKLAANALLSPENRQIYDAQLAALPEMQQTYAQDTSEWRADAASNSVSAYAQGQSAAATAAEEQDDSDGVTLYHNIRRPDTPARAFSLAKMRENILKSPLTWFVLALLLYGAYQHITAATALPQQAQAACLEAIHAQLPQPDSFQQSAAQRERQLVWSTQEDIVLVSIHYSATAPKQQPSHYAAHCIYDGVNASLSDISITTRSE
ncbi:hypothetical protein LVJ82_15800 [Vitreoscilla massiliensis]|uniref:J domain-containing protein n=1 Tax=Vitreoscilla massiliensis TaxID=1689272 RepID=A0ABY4DZE4_9NEIS|nr:hypothetical protein [Vitreoscilla massiliensis]UOO88901.1 hypothetical protein LVJ82_15800 [Vitreoscilla massiliensis]